MSLVNVDFPYQYVPDNDRNRAIASGYIYIGEPDLDPEIIANQKTIYFVQEDGNEVVGAQPIRTSAGGVPTYNGSPVAIKTEGDYSIKILDKNSVQVYYSPNSNVEAAILNALQTVDTLAELPAAADNSGQVRYVEGVGVVKSNGTDWLPDETIVTPLATGGVGDGSDDTTPFEDAAAQGRDVFVTPPTAEWALDNAVLEDVTLRGLNYPKLTAFGAAAITTLKDNAGLSGLTIDGEGVLSNRILLGDNTDPSDNIKLTDLVVVNAPESSVRTAKKANRIFYTDSVVSGCESFNTNDEWDGNGVILSRRMVINVPASQAGTLIDQPGAVTSRTGVIHTDHIYTLDANSRRCVGFATTKDIVTANNVYLGASGVQDIVHIEDDLARIIIANELIRTNGASHGIDGSLGGDPKYVPFESGSGTFSVGETVTGGTSGNSGVVSEVKSGMLVFSSNTGSMTTGETITGGTSGATATASARNPEQVVVGNCLIDADSSVDYGVWLEGSAPNHFGYVLINGVHVKDAQAAASVRAREGLITNVVAYDPSNGVVRVTKSDTGGGDKSETGQDVLTYNNYAIRPTYIRKSPGHCFDPTNVPFSYSFADDGALVGYPKDGISVAFTGSPGTGGSITYPLDADGVKYLKAEIGTTAMTRDLTISLTPSEMDIQNLDTIAVQVMTRSTAQNIGELRMIISDGAGINLEFKQLNEGSDFADWHTEGFSVIIPSGTDLYTNDNIDIELRFADSLGSSGDVANYAWIKVSHVKGY